MEYLIALGQLAALAGAIVGWVREYRKRKQIEEAVRRKVEEEAEAERLKDTYERIDKEPPKSGKDLLDSLNR